MFSSLIANSLVGAGQWRWIYYIALILNVLGLTGIVLFYRPPPPPEHEKSVFYRFIRLDWLGIFLFLAGITLFLLGIFFGAKATTYAWNTAKVIATMVSLAPAPLFDLYLISRSLGSLFSSSSFSGRSTRQLNTKYSLQLFLNTFEVSIYFASTCLSPARSCTRSTPIGLSLSKTFTPGLEITGISGFWESSKERVL